MKMLISKANENIEKISNTAESELIDDDVGIFEVNKQDIIVEDIVPMSIQENGSLSTIKNYSHTKSIPTEEISYHTNPTWNKARYEDRQRALAKHNIILSFRQFKIEHKKKGIRYSDSGAMFVIKLQRGEICRDYFNTLKVNSIPLPTLIRWEGMLKAGGDYNNPIYLLEGFRNCGRPYKLDLNIRNWIKEMAIDERNLNPTWIYEFLTEELSYEDKELGISERALQLMVKGFRNEVIAMSSAKGKKAVHDNVKLHNVRINNLLPGEIWESDGHVCNFLVKSPFYCHRNVKYRYLVRPVIIFWWDVATGCVMGYGTSPTENKDVVRNSLMNAIMINGLPEQARLDNGGSYKNVEYVPHEFLKRVDGKRKLTNTEKIAKRMIESGNRGLFGNMGIKVIYTKPYNPESKSIESFWSYAISRFEKQFKSWIGNNIESRPDKYKNQDNKTLVRKYADDFPTWNEFLNKLDEFVQYYNNKPRNYLQTIEGESMSPIEAYNKVEHKLPTKIEIQTKMRDPYIEMRMVQRSMIEKNGILYWHPIFATMIGKKIGIYYDERNLNQLTICSDKGQIYDEKAIAINPGLQSGDDLKSMIENNRRAKLGELCYLSLCDVSGVKKIERMLKIIGTELLPISSLTEKEPDVKYLSFDDALDSIAGEEDIKISNNIPKTELNEDDKELMKSLKDDIAGMF